MELRGCWEAKPAAHEAAPTGVAEPTAHRLRRGAGARGGDPAPARDFVPLELLGRLPARPEPAREDAAPEAELLPPPLVLGEPDPDWAGRTSLFGDAEA